MTPGMKVAAAVVGGYVLGRRKKAKLAITMGAWLVGRKLNLDPKKLLSDVTRELASSPELAGVRDQVRDEVLGAGKTLAADILTHQAGRLAGSLQEHTDTLRDKAAGLPAIGGGDSDDREPEAADDNGDDGGEESETRPPARKRPAKSRSASPGERKPARKASSGSSSSTARKRTSSGGRTQKRSSSTSGVNRG
ncbi:hypothetical protein L3Q65_21270 [Amycolatopsis sp. FU40]|uniref:hypothetical protein n=1 Tax=Amycolatopsis sp. FU40 TaxID=2914159 RepID=UPI001F32F114|nr:hypothetical protein [Amycolatopsis sp. FU40]UKD59145.1 hypothetical protein L3Q65_21270 [Amycolatopsis sp. FU40]